MIEYKDGYKYQLHKPFKYKTDIYGYSVVSEFISLFPNGELTISEGYAWDGCSGPTYDTSNTMEAALVHDALYQLGRDGLIREKEKSKADDIFYKILREKGVNLVRAWLFYQAVKYFGFSSYKKQKEEVHQA